MKIILGTCFLAAALLCMVKADVACYNNWEQFVGAIIQRCKDCKKNDTEATAECFTKSDYPLDSDGNLITEEYLNYQLDADHYVGSNATFGLIKKGYEECMKNGAKTRVELHDVDNCICNVLNANCEDAKPWIDKLNGDADMIICMS